MFDPQARDALRDSLIERARGDRRIVAAAAVGSTAGETDRWSDLDLTFGVASSSSVPEALSEWTEMMVEERDAAVLFDLARGQTIYRVFLLPRLLQVDLSFAPASEFGAYGPRFLLYFGDALAYTPPAEAMPSSAAHQYGIGVHHLVRAHICIERGSFWQAEYLIHSTRDIALTLACERLGLVMHYGRGFDRLPDEITAPFLRGMPAGLEIGPLRRALAVTAGALLREGARIDGADTRVPDILREITGDAAA